MTQAMLYNSRFIQLTAISVMLTLQTGCFVNPPTPDDPYYAPVIPDFAPEKKVINGSLFSKNQLALFHDMKAHSVGDIITVVLTEETEAEKKSATEVKKESDVTLTNPTLFGTVPQFSQDNVSLPLQGKGMTLETSVDGDTAFKGKGDSDQSNSLTGTITVTITRVFPNGNLEVKGEKWMKLNQGDEYIRLSGIVRPQDITPENTVLSTRIANSRIAYSGTGDVYNGNNMGWMMKFFASAFWPF